MSRWNSKALFLSLLVLAGSAHAAYNLRYSTIAPGALTFTGNTIGLDKANNSNNPGTSMAIGAYIAEGQGAATYSGHPAPTSANWLLNRSNATLTIPAGATVLYAELIWGGSYSYGGQFRSLAERNGAVDFITPSGTNSVTPSGATAVDLNSGTGGTCSGNPPCFYVRSQDVTTIVQALGTGTIPLSVGKIPATIGASENNLNTGGWTLAVAYRDTTKVEHKMNIYVGAEFVYNGMPGGGSSAAVTNFCTAPSGAQSGRLLASAMEGDAGISGDEFRFGATNPAPTANKLNGPRNLVGNFFAGQINNDLGNTATNGSFGTSNQTPGTAGQGRQGWDVTNVALDSFLTAAMTTAHATATTTGDTYVVNGLGIQIKVGQPGFPTAVKRVNGIAADGTNYPAYVAKVGEILTYTVKMNNSTGTAAATNLTFTDLLPTGLSFVPGSFSRGNVIAMSPDPAIPPATDPDVAGAGAVPMPAANPVSPSTVPLPDIPAGQGVVVRFQAKVDSVPVAPTAASYLNRAQWEYDYVPCAGQPTIHGTKITNPVLTYIPRMAATKVVSPTGAQNAGTTLTYTVTMTNNGLANSIGSTMVDAIPAGATYVLGSTTLNGSAVADVSGAMPYATANLVNSAGQAAGVIAVGASATVSFNVTIDGNASTVSNTAVADIDGPGGTTDPGVTPPPVNTNVTPAANVSITKSNAAASVIKGGTSTYTITVNNTGPSAADNAIVQDPAATGLNCTTVTCPAGSLTGGATCPAVLTIPALQGAGLTVPNLPANSSVTLNVTCTITATGV